MAIRQYEFTLTGLTPLLMHQDDVELGDEIKEWRKNPDNSNLSTPGDDRSPPWTWKTYCYTDGDVIGIPSDNVMVAIRQAGATVKIKGNKTFKSETQSGIVIHQVHLPLVIDGEPIKASDIEDIDGTFKEHIEAAKKLGFVLFVKRAKPDGAKGKHVRVRPRFNKWSLSGTLEVSADEITDDILKKIFEIAGRSKGLCDWRPSAPKSPGPYGRFSVSLKKLAA